MSLTLSLIRPRSVKGMEEDVEIDKEGNESFNAEHVGTISVGALLNVIEWLKHGVSLFDTEVPRPRCMQP